MRKDVYHNFSTLFFSTNEQASKPIAYSAVNMSPSWKAAYWQQMIELHEIKIYKLGLIKSKFSRFLLLLLPLCQGCCYQTYDYQNIPEGSRMKGIVATRNVPSA